LRIERQGHGVCKKNKNRLGMSNRRLMRALKAGQLLVKIGLPAAQAPRRERRGFTALRPAFL
jgi:hypothetical protein